MVGYLPRWSGVQGGLNVFIGERGGGQGLEHHVRPVFEQNREECLANFKSQQHAWVRPSEFQKIQQSLKSGALERGFWVQHSKRKKADEFLTKLRARRGDRITGGLVLEFVSNFWGKLVGYLPRWRDVQGGLDVLIIDPGIDQGVGQQVGPVLDWNWEKVTWNFKTRVKMLRRLMTCSKKFSNLNKLAR